MTDTTILKKCITLGPWGICAGKEWVYIPEGFIKKIRILHGSTGIHGIEFHNESRQGASQKSYFGGDVRCRTDMICIDYPDEYLTSISGTAHHSSVMSLCFHTNQNQYGPYGDSNKGTAFSFDGKGGLIVGFHGGFGNQRISIGIYVMPKALAMDRSSTFEQSSRPEKCRRVSTVGIPRDLGPWGASEGKAWDDGVFYNIKQVRVHIGDPSNVIVGIQFKYVRKNGKCILSRLHGGLDGDVSEMEINLDGSEEYLTRISGFYGPVKEFDGLEGITSITFHTNKGKHGPFGHESGAGCVYFISTSSSGKVVGFHGRNDDFLTAIGVHMQYF